MIEVVKFFIYTGTLFLFLKKLAYLLVWSSNLFFSFVEKKDKYFEKLKGTVEEKTRLKREAKEAQLREEQQSLRIKAEKAEAERIGAESQIRVSE